MERHVKTRGRRFRPAPLFAFVTLFALALLFAVATLPATSAEPAERVASKRYPARSGDGPRPTVMVLGGSEGGMVDARRPLLRALRDAGYDVVALATFGHPGLPKTGARVPLDRIAGRARAIRKRSGACLAFVGISRGSEAALLLAALSPGTFDATVAIVPAHVAGPAPGPNLFNRPAWTWEGEDVPFLPVRPFTRHGVRWLLGTGRERAAANHAIKLDSIRSQPDAERRARIPIARVGRPVLLLSATRDHVWPSQMMAERLVTAAREAGVGSLVRHEAIDGDHFIADRPAGIRAALRFLRKHLGSGGACRRR